MSVLMELSKIIIRDHEETQIIFLREVAGERRFPIVIGSEVAAAIKRRLEGTPPLRPMTHELLANVIDELGGKLEQIEITDLQDHTYYAKVILRQDKRRIEIDSRPSDAIALGIAHGVPIYVEEHVLDAASD